jgi:hypothetical protein
MRFSRASHSKALFTLLLWLVFPAHLHRYRSLVDLRSRALRNSMSADSA